MKNISFVGVAGFEPATSSSQTRRDNRATLHPEALLGERKDMYFLFLDNSILLIFEKNLLIPCLVKF